MLEIRQRGFGHGLSGMLRDLFPAQDRQPAVVVLHGSEGPQAAGHVIQAFGNFVVGGNYVVGMIIIWFAPRNTELNAESKS